MTGAGHHRGEVIHDGRGSRAIFRRYNYMFFKALQSEGETREREVSVCVFRVSFLLTIIFDQWPPVLLGGLVAFTDGEEAIYGLECDAENLWWQVSDLI